MYNAGMHAAATADGCRFESAEHRCSALRAAWPAHAAPRSTPLASHPNRCAPPLLRPPRARAAPPPPARHRRRRQQGWWWLAAWAPPPAAPAEGQQVPRGENQDRQSRSSAEPHIAGHLPAPLRLPTRLHLGGAGADRHRGHVHRHRGGHRHAGLGKALALLADQLPSLLADGRHAHPAGGAGGDTGGGRVGAGSDRGARQGGSIARLRSSSGSTVSLVPGLAAQPSGCLEARAPVHALRHASQALLGHSVHVGQLALQARQAGGSVRRRHYRQRHV